MSEHDTQPNGSGGQEDDLLAAEYVLGVLDAEARRACEARLARDAAFAALVEAWQQRFEEMNEAYVQEVPPARVRAGIEARLFARRRNEPSLAQRLWRNLALWRSLAAICAAGLVAVGLYAGGIISPPGPGPAPALYVAALEPTEDGRQVIAVYDSESRTLHLSERPADPPSGRDLELWVGVGETPPVSLGVLPRQGEPRVALSGETLARLSERARAEGAYLAISSEPEGGSPTGAPTGPVLSLGSLRRI